MSTGNRGEPFESEVRRSNMIVPPARPIEIFQSKNTLVTEAGIVPLEIQTDHTRTLITGLFFCRNHGSECGKYEVVHGGFDAKFANEDRPGVSWTRQL